MAAIGLRICEAMTIRSPGGGGFFTGKSVEDRLETI
jgi:hypothetical protein